MKQGFDDDGSRRFTPRNGVSGAENQEGSCQVLTIGHMRVGGTDESPRIVPFPRHTNLGEVRHHLSHLGFGAQPLSGETICQIMWALRPLVETGTAVKTDRKVIALIEALNANTWRQDLYHIFSKDLVDEIGCYLGLRLNFKYGRPRKSGLKNRRRGIASLATVLALLLIRPEDCKNLPKINCDL